MDWIVRPLAAFETLNASAAANCTGGNTLNHCNSYGSLLSCACSGGLVLPSNQ